MTYSLKKFDFIILFFGLIKKQISKQSTTTKPKHPQRPRTIPRPIKMTKTVRFLGDSENLMKPPCKTMFYQKDDAPINLGKEKAPELPVLKVSANAWRPKRFRK